MLHRDWSFLWEGARGRAEALLRRLGQQLREVRRRPGDTSSTATRTARVIHEGILSRPTDSLCCSAEEDWVDYSSATAGTTRSRRWTTVQLQSRPTAVQVVEKAAGESVRASRLCPGKIRIAGREVLALRQGCGRARLRAAARRARWGRYDGRGGGQEFGIRARWPRRLINHPGLLPDDRHRLSAGVFGNDMAEICGVLAMPPYAVTFNVAQLRSG